MPAAASAPTAEACFINIGPRQRQLRMRFGLFALALSLGAAALLVASHSPVAWRLGLFAPLYVSAVGVFQAREKT
jgi:hypothetical protein